MHVITIPEGISKPIPVAEGVPMEAGKQYLVTNVFTGSLLSSRWRVVIGEDMWAVRMLLKAEHYEEEPFNPKRTHPINDLWLLRGGGYGDLLMMTPMIRALRAAYPNIRLHVACGSSYKDLFYGLDVTVEELPIAFPIPRETVIVAFEDWIEGHPGAEQTHMAQHFANKVGIDLKSDHRPSYTVTEEEEEAAKTAFPRNNQKRIGIQVFASSLYRTYPFIQDVTTLFLKKGCEVFFFGAPGQFKLEEGSPPELINLTNQKLTFRQSAAVLTTCDVVVAPDSAMVHLAAALDIPCVGLYGPIPPELRGSGKMSGLFGKAPCAPCFFHADYPQQFPANMPCAEKGYCVALAQIEPELIVAKALERCQGRIITLR